MTNKKIQDIAPLLAHHFVEMDPDLINSENYNKLIKANYQRVGKYFNYFPLLHDSECIESKLTEGKYSLILNDFTRYIFALALTEKKKFDIDPESLVFPLQIDFEIIDITFNTVDDEGYIHQIKPLEIDIYLYEQVLGFNSDTIDIGLIFYNRRKIGPGDYILILIKAKKIILTEFQDSKWKSYFGDHFDNYLEYYKSQLEQGEYLSDQWICEKLIDEYDSVENGL